MRRIASGAGSRFRAWLRGPWGRFAWMAAMGGIGAAAMLLVHGLLRIPATAAETLFQLAHPAHVFVGAMTMTRLLAGEGRVPVVKAAAIGIPVSVGIVTVTDSLFPFLAELLLQLPSRHFHIGFVELWWLVGPAAIAGVAVAWRFPHLRIQPLLVLAATALPPLYDMTMAMWEPLDPVAIVTVSLFVSASLVLYLFGTVVSAAAVVRATGAPTSTGWAIGRRMEQAQFSGGG